MITYIHISSNIHKLWNLRQGRSTLQPSFLLHSLDGISPCSIVCDFSFIRFWRMSISAWWGRGGGVRAVTMLSGDWVVWWLGGVGAAACWDSWGRVSGEAGGLRPNSRPRCARASSSKVYPAGKLHCHFTCGFNFGHSLSLPFVGGFTVLELWLIVPVGTIGCFQPGVNPFKIVGEPMGCVQSRELGARPFCLPSLILLGSISLVTLYLWFPF